MTVLTSQVLGCHDGRALGLQVAAVASERVGAVQLHSLLLSGKFCWTIVALEERNPVFLSFGFCFWQGHTMCPVLGSNKYLA